MDKAGCGFEVEGPQLRKKKQYTADSRLYATVIRRRAIEGEQRKNNIEEAKR